MTQTARPFRSVLYIPGSKERALDKALIYAKERKQFGKSISEFQSVSNRVANMKLRMENSRLLLYQVAWLKSQGKSAMMEAALLKLQLSESFMASSIDAIRCNGGRGYLSENEVRVSIKGSDKPAMICTWLTLLVAGKL